MDIHQFTDSEFSYSDGPQSNKNDFEMVFDSKNENEKEKETKGKH